MLAVHSRTNDISNDFYAYSKDKDPLSPRSPYITSSPILNSSISPRPDSMALCTLDDILLPADVVAEGGFLQGEPISRVSLGSSPRASFEGSPEPQPATEFEVVRRLGTGSYAVVYLVREILSRSHSPSASEDSAILGSLELDSPYCSSDSRSSSVVYGREYAIKCLSKANLDEEQLSAQMTEVKVHQSLLSHHNIVTLHRTLETPSFLLLLLEFVPGEDLFYFLEQARDHMDPIPDDSFTSIASNTPPTPSLLSTLAPSQLLSRTRLRLVASMFGQMCDAVAACHTQGVYHRDIKPENFIVTDGFISRPDGRRERKVIVKLTDFGLSTVDQMSTDMDCGSAPYMSYECRNNVAPSYRTDAADVWSLGIVLINMLYHHNPWTDTAQGACSSFALYRSNPIEFFMTRFQGMTRTVADFLVTRVFCILEDGNGPTGAVRASAREFGGWVHSLPDLISPVEPVPFVKRHQRVVSTASSIDHPVSSTSQVSHRPCSRNPSGSTSVPRTPALRSSSLSRAPSVVGMVYDRSELSELSTVIDQDIEDSQEHLPLHLQSDDRNVEALTAAQVEYSPSPSRSASNRRRKRGRKGKGNSVSVPSTGQDVVLESLAKASQTLAREISKQSKASKISTQPSVASSGHSRRSTRSEPSALFPVPLALLSGNAMAPPPLPALATSAASRSVETTSRNSQQTPAPPTPSPAPTKKPSKWKLSIGKSKGSAAPSPILPHEEPVPASPLTPPSAFAIKNPEPPGMSAAASQVANLLNGLNAPPASASSSSLSPQSEDVWPRGRRHNKDSPTQSYVPSSRSPAGSQSRSRTRRNGSSAFGSTTDIPVPPVPPQHSLFSSPNNSSDSWARFDRERGRSPHSTKSLNAPSVSSSSSNWRSSMSTTSSALTSTSAFTSYSNASSRSVSTAATSVSASSWRNKDNSSIFSHGSSRYHQAHPNVPRNVKIMSGVPSELVSLPRGQHPSSFDKDDSSGKSLAGARKHRARKPMDLPLGTISERPNAIPPPDTSKSPPSDGSPSSPETGSAGKAQRGQITALEKLLSALRR